MGKICHENKPLFDLEVKVPRRSLRYTTHRLMVMHPHTKYHWPIWKDKKVMVRKSFAAKKRKKKSDYLRSKGRHTYNLAKHASAISGYKMNGCISIVCHITASSRLRVQRFFRVYWITLSYQFIPLWCIWMTTIDLLKWLMTAWVSRFSDGVILQSRVSTLLMHFR